MRLSLLAVVILFWIVPYREKPVASAPPVGFGATKTSAGRLLRASALATGLLALLPGSARTQPVITPDTATQAYEFADCFLTKTLKQLKPDAPLLKQQTGPSLTEKQVRVDALEAALIKLRDESGNANVRAMMEGLLDSANERHIDDCASMIVRLKSRMRILVGTCTSIIRQNTSSFTDAI